MGNLILLLLCLGAGMVFKRFKSFPAQAHKGINGFIIWVALPAISLVYIPRLTWEWQMLFPALMPWLVLLLAVPFFHVAGKIWGWKRSLVGSVILVGGLGNTSFVGFPLLEYLYGSKDILQYAILCDQPGSFLAVSVLGVSLAAIYSSGRPKAKEILGKLIGFPPFIAFVIALLISPFGGMPAEIVPAFERLGDTLSPLALFSIGLQIEFRTDGLRKSALLIGLLYKLLLAPLSIWLLYKFVFLQSGILLDISVLEAAMASMVTAALIASEYDLEPNFANLQVALSIPISLISVPMWWLFLS
jgi:malate permease and related proteins